MTQECGDGAGEQEDVQKRLMTLPDKLSPGGGVPVGGDAIQAKSGLSPFGFGGRQPCLQIDFQQADHLQGIQMMALQRRPALI